jgi:hypothetical protein
MSAESQPITLAAFAEAIKALPLSAVYAKVLELRNSIAHLRRSNEDLRMYIATYTTNTVDELEKSSDGVPTASTTAAAAADNQELENYIVENEGVIVAMAERIALLKTEIEDRGQRWIELDEHENDNNDGNDENNNLSSNITNAEMIDADAGEDSDQIISGHPSSRITSFSTTTINGIRPAANAISDGSTVNDARAYASESLNYTIGPNQAANRQSSELSESDDGVFL